MANIITDNVNYTNIANAIREKTGGNETYLPSEMAAAIAGIVTGSGGAIKMATGTFAASNANTMQVTFDTTMDNAPDFVVFYETGTSYGSQYRTKIGAGANSSILVNRTTQYYQVLLYGSTGNSIGAYSNSYPITITTGTTGCPIKNATATGFMACGQSNSYPLRGTYRYIAVSFS